MKKMSKKTLKSKLKEWKQNLFLKKVPWTQVDEDAYSQIIMSIEATVKKKISKDDIFIQHIQNHLKQGQEVICKICGKTAKEIIGESDE